MIETPVFGHAAVAAPHSLAATTGRTVLAQGGNAIEAMVAMAATIAVVYPHMNAIGGDGFWLVSDRRRQVRYIEACGFAGERATIRAYAERGHDVIPLRGPPAALTVPGAIGGWTLALDMAKAFGGTLPLGLLLEDAIRHAKAGVPVSPSQARVEPDTIEDLATAPGFEVFLKEGKGLPAGEPMVQADLGATLAYLAHAGLDDFYRGDIGRELAAGLEKVGSPVTRSDLARYEAGLRSPLALALADGTVYGTPPPTQGLATLLILGQFERAGVTRPETFPHIHTLVEAVKRALAIRNRVITDPAFMTHDPAAFLTPKALAREAAMISTASAGPSPAIDAAGDTIWMGAIDTDGLAVSYIQSVFHDFGSGVVVPKTGVLMQNRGASFSLDPRAKNPLAPGRLPFHTLNPCMAVFADGRVMPFGTMGGDGQPQILSQVFTRLRLGMGIADALDAPRFVLGTPPGGRDLLLRLENRFDDAVVRALERAGHPVAVQDAPYADVFGHSGVLLRHPRDGRIEAAHDPRSDGGSMGL